MVREHESLMKDVGVPHLLDPVHGACCHSERKMHPDAARRKSQPKEACKNNNTQQCLYRNIKTNMAKIEIELHKAGT